MRKSVFFRLSAVWMTVSAVLTATCLIACGTNVGKNTVLEPVPEEFKERSLHPGTMERLQYQTWESFTYDEHSQGLEKEAWVYLPYGYTPDKRYNIFYISHGAWSDETTVMGTDGEPSGFKDVIDNAMDAGRISPMILVMLTYNNTDDMDSWDTELSARLTEQFHNELMNDLIPAVEERYSTYAEDTTPDKLRKSRDHRGFGGYSMGSVHTWCTFCNALDYFRYFMPISGGYTSDGRYMAEAVEKQGYTSKDFFIYALSGPDDFAYYALKDQLDAMGTVKDTFIDADTDKKGNYLFREMGGYEHGPEAADLFTYNGLRYFWN